MFENTFKWLNLIVIIMLILILICTFIVLSTALTNIHYSSKRINIVITDALSYLVNNNSKFEDNIPETAKSYIEDLKAQGKIGIDSNTVTFLFQIFSVSLISIGVYLLRIYSKETIKIKKLFSSTTKEVNKIQPMLFSIVEGSKIERFLTFAYQTLQLANSQRNDNVGYLIVQARDWIKSSYDTILLLKDKKGVGIEREQYNNIKDLLDQIIVIGKTNVDEINLIKIKEMKMVLENIDFIKRYEKIDVGI